MAEYLETGTKDFKVDTIRDNIFYLHIALRHEGGNYPLAAVGEPIDG